MNRRYYGPLRDGKRPTLDDLNKHIEGKEPERDTGNAPRRAPMSREFYEPLRQPERRTLDDLNQHIEQGMAPTRRDAMQTPQVEDSLVAEPHRPEKMPARGATWTERGDMASQQESAVDMIRAHNDQREITEASRARREQPETRERTEASIEREAQEASREITQDRNQPDIPIDPTIPRDVDRGDF